MKNKINKWLDGMMKCPRMYAGHMETYEMLMISYLALVYDRDTRDQSDRWFRFVNSRGHETSCWFFHTYLTRKLTNKGEEGQWKIMIDEVAAFIKHERILQDPS